MCSVAVRAGRERRAGEGRARGSEGRRKSSPRDRAAAALAATSRRSGKYILSSSFGRSYFVSRQSEERSLHFILLFLFRRGKGNWLGRANETALLTTLRLPRPLGRRDGRKNVFGARVSE